MDNVHGNLKASGSKGEKNFSKTLHLNWFNSQVGQGTSQGCYSHLQQLSGELLYAEQPRHSSNIASLKVD
jgi:hypothetical protein